MKYWILFSFCMMWACEQPTLVVKTRSGLLRGVISKDGLFAKYLSVPYAYTDYEHRFQAPLPVPPWEGVFNAIDENVRCPQRLGSMVIGQEDCLRLNIYTPLNIHQPLPVMVFIHGGGFFEGSSSPAIYGPDYLIEKSVILVTMNYRMNIQGFLCLRIPEAPGNAGLKDQVAALKWVKENIGAFGGNPDDVTIFGESAGSASVSFHLLSPMSKDLFHKAILQSGSSLTGWTHQYNPVYLASLLSRTMGYDSQDPYELYKIFMSKTDEELVATRVPRPRGSTILSELLYTPCVEKVLPGVEAFITDTPHNLLSSGKFNKVPIMIGFTSDEGLLLIAMENDTTIEELIFEKSLPKNLHFPTEEEKKDAADKLQRLYLGDEKISKETAVKISKLHGEPYFNHPGAAETELILAKTDKPVYNYKLYYDGYLNIAKRMSGFSEVGGATHADDIFYLFKPRSFPTPQRFLERQMIDRMTTLWTNFAKFGDPTPQPTVLLPVKWNATEKKSPQVFVIDKEFSTEPLWSSESMLYWRELYQKYRRKESVN